MPRTEQVATMNVVADSTKTESKDYCKGNDFLTLGDGSTYHLGTKKGEVAQRILTVGSVSRAKKIAEACFDDGKIEFEKVSSRMMATYNGKFNGVPVSIIAIGMGSPMMDFMIREASYCQPKEIACVRLGTCGISNSVDRPGTIFTADKGSMYSYVNYGHQAGGHVGGEPADSAKPYFLTKPIKGDDNLHQNITKALKAKGIPTASGLNTCGETFYACQGRLNDDFEDEDNTQILSDLQQSGVDFLEMETHQLFSLAMRRKVPLYAASACIGIVSRTFSTVVGAEDLNKLEIEGGRACLQALVDFKLKDQ